MKKRFRHAAELLLATPESEGFFNFAPGFLTQVCGIVISVFGFLICVLGIEKPNPEAAIANRRLMIPGFRMPDSRLGFSISRSRIENFEGGFVILKAVLKLFSAARAAQEGSQT